MIFQFKISLLDVGVPVWRRIQVTGDTTFRELHDIIQIAFDWSDSHLHSFSVRKSNGEIIQDSTIEPDNEYQGPDSEDDDWLELASFTKKLNEEEETVTDWFKKEKDRIVYTYDFGDDWEHDIILEEILEPFTNRDYPICLKAKNDTPEEDSRGDNSSLINSNSKGIVNEINSRL